MGRPVLGWRMSWKSAGTIAAERAEATPPLRPPYPWRMTKAASGRYDAGGGPPFHVACPQRRDGRNGDPALTPARIPARRRYRRRAGRRRDVGRVLRRAADPEPVPPAARGGRAELGIRADVAAYPRRQRPRRRAALRRRDPRHHAAFA